MKRFTIEQITLWYGADVVALVIISLKVYFYQTLESLNHNELGCLYVTKDQIKIMFKKNYV